MSGRDLSTWKDDFHQLQLAKSMARLPRAAIGTGLALFFPVWSLRGAASSDVPCNDQVRQAPTALLYITWHCTANLPGRWGSFTVGSFESTLFVYRFTDSALVPTSTRDVPIKSSGPWPWVTF